MTSGCDSILERPELTKPLDETYGKTDNEYRLYVNEAYPVYFVGYNNSWGSAYAPLRGYNFSDDNASSGKQTSFENTRSHQPRKLQHQRPRQLLDFPIRSRQLELCLGTQMEYND